MKILVQLNHPAHYHLFTNPINKFRENNHTVLITIREKDVLGKLLKHEKYINISHVYRKNNRLSILLNLIKREKKLFNIAKKFKPDIMIGTSPEIAHVGLLLRIPSIFFGEDDAKLLLAGTSIIYPFANVLVSPKTCDNWVWNYKTIAYDGYHEIAYLHPGYFRPSLDKIKNDIDIKKPYYILRFSDLCAWHDKGKKGISGEIAAKIIEMLSPTGNVYITSEKPLAADFETYRIKIDPLDIHHALYYATMFIGDSQTMASEAGILGTPSIRFNDFVGKIGCMEELEHKYGLTYGITSSEPEKLFKKIGEFLNYPDIKKEWEKRRLKMFAEKIDVTAFIVWLVENYPGSIKIMKKDPGYQDKFMSMKT